MRQGRIARRGECGGVRRCLLGVGRAWQGLGRIGLRLRLRCWSLGFRSGRRRVRRWGNRGRGSRRALRREEQRPGDDALLDRDRAGGRVVRVIGARGQCERLPVGRPAAHVDRVGQQVAFVRAQLVEVRICAVLLERGGQRGGRFRREACSRVLRHCAGYRGNGQPGQVRAQRIRARGHGAALVADDVLEDTAFDDASVGHVAKERAACDGSVVRHAAVERAARQDGVVVVGVGIAVGYGAVERAAGYGAAAGGGVFVVACHGAGGGERAARDDAPAENLAAERTAFDGSEVVYFIRVERAAFDGAGSVLVGIEPHVSVLHVCVEYALTFDGSAVVHSDVELAAAYRAVVGHVVLYWVSYQRGKIWKRFGHCIGRR